MNTQQPTNKLETALLLAMGVVIFLSKPAIYIISLLLIILAVVRLTVNPLYRRSVLDQPLFYASIFLFSLGVISAAVGSNDPNDVGWMAKKTMLIPLTVPFLLAFASNTNRLASLVGIIVGFWIAFILTGNLHDWSWSGKRLQGATWLVDTWGVICAMLIVFMTPLVFKSSLRGIWRLVLICTLLGAILMLLTTGARGAWLGVFLSIFIYLAMKQRTALFIVIALGIFTSFLAQSFYPKQVESTKARITSITSFETNSSAYIRIALWEAGTALIIKQLTSGDKGFWFGNGHDGKNEIANNFYYNEFSDKAAFKPGILEKYDWKINDLHNMYLQSIFHVLASYRPHTQRPRAHAILGSTPFIT